MKVYETEENGDRCPHCGYVRGTPPKEPFDLPAETVLSGQYVIGTAASCGGFGILYKAYDTKNRRVVAIKEYYPAGIVSREPGKNDVLVFDKKRTAEFENGIRGFLDEARNTSRFSEYENIVKVYDFFEANHTAYMVMEFMPGITVKEYLKMHGGRMPWEMARVIGASVAEILAVVHKGGILHRDVSPDNIMITDEGRDGVEPRVKLFDFGAARFSDTEREHDRQVILKIGYAPPEQYNQTSIQGPYTDVYALGATIYHCVSGILPAESQNRLEALRRGEEDPVKPLRELVPEVPEYFNNAVIRAMAVEPQFRFQNMKDFRRALCGEKTTEDVEHHIRRLKRRQRLMIGGIAGMIGAGAVFCSAVYRGQARAASLAGTQLEVMIAGTAEDAGLFRQMSEEFQADYPDVILTITNVDESGYEDALRERIDGGNAPDLFELDSPSGENDGHAAALDSLFVMLSEEAEGGKTEEEYFLSRDQNSHFVPLEWEPAVRYKNQAISANSGDAGDAANSLENFLTEKTGSCVAGVGSYRTVQDAIPGKYQVSLPDHDRTPVRYRHLMAVSAKTDSITREAAERLLAYYLGEKAQDILCVRNFTALPVNRSTFRLFTDQVNVELNFLSDFSPMDGKLVNGQDFQQACDDLEAELDQEGK